MTPFIIGVAGGSGSGKSTLAFSLQDKFQDNVLIFHIDDYFKPEKEVPTKSGLVNWDDPGALYSQKMAQDLALLKSGKPVTIHTKSPRFNPNFLKTGERIPVEFTPKPLIVVEGFLALHYPEIRTLCDISIYLDAPFELRSKRRVHGKLHNFSAAYDELILQPMHEQYVEPSKQHADIVLDIAELTQNEVLSKVIDMLPAEVTTVLKP